MLWRGPGEAIEKPIVVGAPNHLLSIDEIWVFVSKDEDGNEGVCGCPLPGGAGMMPMVCADEERVDSLRQMAQMIADNTDGHDIVLRKFSVCEDLEVITKRENKDETN